MNDALVVEIQQCVDNVVEYSRTLGQNQLAAVLGERERKKMRERMRERRKMKKEGKEKGTCERE